MESVLQLESWQNDLQISGIVDGGKHTTVKRFEFRVGYHRLWLTDQRPVLWCTPWACEEAGRRTHSSARASRGDGLKREGSSVSCAESRTKWPPSAPPVLQCGHVIPDHWRTPSKNKAEKEEDELWKQNGKSVSLTSGPTMDRGSVMVATMSLATSIASWPTQNTQWKHTHCHFKPHTQHTHQFFEWLSNIMS